MKRTARPVPQARRWVCRRASRRLLNDPEGRRLILSDMESCRVADTATSTCKFEETRSVLQVR
jgi:hypothetical protein